MQKLKISRSYNKMKLCKQINERDQTKLVIKSSYVMRNYHKSCWQSKTASIVYFVWQNAKYRYGKNVFSQKTKISPIRLDKMALVSAKIKIRI